MNIHSLHLWRSLGIIAWLLLAVTLAACGGAAQTEEAAPAAEEATAEEEPAADAQEMVADAETDADEEAAEEAAEEEPAADAQETTADDEAIEEETMETANEEEQDAEAADTNENLLDPSAAPQEVACSPLEIPENTLIAEVSAEDWSLGPEDAPITVIEYGDFQ